MLRFVVRRLLQVIPTLLLLSLLVFGWLNALFLWVWDILNLYALAGFFLLLIRKWPAKRLAVFGLVLALYSDNVQEGMLGAMGISLVPASHFADAAVLALPE